MDSLHILIRLRWLALVLSIFIIGIAYHLFKLQIVWQYDFFTLGTKNFTRYEKIASLRGSIRDVKGTLLATNRPIVTLCWQGTGAKSLTQAQLDVLAKVKAIIPISDESLAKIHNAERKAERTPLALDISFEQISKILEQCADDKNIILSHEFKRFYPYKNVASHSVGYLGSINRALSGRMGLERLGDDVLKGEPGKLVKTINSAGKRLAQEEIKQALAGETLHTTLNVDLQILAEELFPQQEAGAMILLDARTGALEVVLSHPSFDPNIFLQPIDPQTWKSLEEQRCFINRAFDACYPPASIFKLVTLTAALEEKLIETTTSWYCTGYTVFGNRPYYCKRHEGHGVLSTTQAVAHSCNIPFFELGKKLKINTLAHYASLFGLGHKTGIILPEKKGLIPTSEWKHAVKGEPWWPGETLSATIGQSFLLTTPLQVARMVSAIGEGYLVQPRILITEPIIKEQLKINPQTRDFLKTTMRQVVEKGSARILQKLQITELYAKTGTAQTSSLEKSSLGKSFTEHGWCVIYFVLGERAYTLVVLVENIGSSKVAVDLAYTYLKQVLNKFYSAKNS